MGDAFSQFDSSNNLALALRPADLDSNQVNSSGQVGHAAAVDQPGPLMPPHNISQRLGPAWEQWNTTYESSHPEVLRAGYLQMSLQLLELEGASQKSAMLDKQLASVCEQFIKLQNHMHDSNHKTQALCQPISPILGQPQSSATSQAGAGAGASDPYAKWTLELFRAWGTTLKGTETQVFVFKLKPPS